MTIETGVMIPEQGYVQVSGDPVDLSHFPEGTVIVPVRPSPAYDLVNGEWVLDAKKESALLSDINRTQRNILLAKVDVVTNNPLLWADLTSDKQAEWATYRQALLAVPQQSGFPYNVVWPTKPE